MADITSIINNIQQLTGVKVSQADIARALNITRAAVSKRVKTKSALSIEELKIISRNFGVNLIQALVKNSRECLNQPEKEDDMHSFDFAGNLKKIRSRLAMPPAEFAGRLEIPLEEVKLYEQGKKMPSAELFVKLDKKIRVNLNWFVSGRGSMFYSQNTSNQDNFEDKVKEVLKNEGLI